MHSNQPTTETASVGSHRKEPSFSASPGAALVGSPVTMSIGPISQPPIGSTSHILATVTSPRNSPTREVALSEYVTVPHFAVMCHYFTFLLLYFVKTFSIFFMPFLLWKHYWVQLRLSFSFLLTYLIIIYRPVKREGTRPISPSPLGHHQSSATSAAPTIISPRVAAPSKVPLILMWSKL